jgi:hypothetical protein
MIIPATSVGQGLTRLRAPIAQAGGDGVGSRQGEVVASQWR